MKYFAFLSLTFCALFVMSCGDDPVLGCTDPASSTYNALATEDSGDCKYPGCTDEEGDTYDATFNLDDGSCTYFDRFVGSYSGNFECMMAFASLLDEASAEVTKKTDDGNVDQIRVVVSNPATELTFLLDGVITKDEAVIDTYIPEFDYELEVGGTLVEGPFEITITGTLAKVDNTLSGPITIVIVKSPLAISDVCTYTATLN